MFNESFLKSLKVDQPVFGEALSFKDDVILLYG
jgi:hypothetical protein